MPSRSAATRRLLGLALFGFALLAGSAQAAGFDCKRARTTVEISICADPGLSRLDSEMNDLYRQIQSETVGVDGETGRRIDPIAAEQQRWLARRNACADRACLDRAYRDRLAQMKRDWSEALAPSASAPGPAVYRYGRHGDFKVFIADFRRAVAAGDRAAVAKMTAQPFLDYSQGESCLNRPDPCDAEQRRHDASAGSEREVIGLYDRIITAAVRSALQANKIRAYSQRIDAAKDENGEVPSPGPIGPGEYLLDSEDLHAQRVFKKVGGVYKMQRVPFYS
ncbi:lysozyme inhibitor LprI family protein [Lysobacter capsici]|uniref:lysozyme inhibitor LprI family protein n=1 Tax=Lysobacter capsici TaxID=435897 RepID=UPI001C0031E4|nr:lysozyme inhibitor LprI family protein [Lysobacter capsici]QWF17250.1 DUF1311 domain-containing protein [Lysobacter capsici]